MKNGSDLKLIIIEDSSFARLVLSNYMHDFGYTNVDYPEDGAEGWELIAESLVDDEPYDVVITDLNMPGLDGLELIKRIKSDPGSANLKILVISAEAEQAVIDNVLNAGAQKFLVKPVAKNDLKEAIESIISG